MRVSFGQVLVVIVLLFLLFGDFSKIKKKIVNIIKKISK